METLKIEIFESISLLSKLMPYYGSSHEGFLLLSLLSKSIRNYLLEHYPQYRRFMIKYAKMIKNVKDKHLKMKLPLDLFKFSAFYVGPEETANLLAGLILKLTNKEGLYFGEHYMSDQICFEKIYVRPECIPTLHPCIESLNSIKVFPFGGEDLSLHRSFLDLIVLDDIFEYRESILKLKACFFIDSELKKINPIYESFKRVKEDYFSNYNDAFARLNLLEQASIQEIEELNFEEMNEEEVEQITNLLLNYKVNTLDYQDIDNCESISNQTLELISMINPQKLHLPRLRSISNVIRIFLHLREDTNIFFGFTKEFDPLKFEKTLVLFKTKDDVVKAYCDEIGLTFEKDLSLENILFLENYICISNFKDIAVEGFKKVNLTTETPLEGLSLDDLNIESCTLISRNNLSCIKLDFKNISNIFENEINVTNFKSLLSKTKIIVKLSSMMDLDKLNKLKEYFPEHSELVISYTPSCINNTNFDEALLLAILSKFKLTSLRVCNGSKDEDIFMSLLQMSSIQETLEHFSIDELYILQCSSVVELLVEFKRVKRIQINCHYYLNDDSDKIKECKLKMKQFEKNMEKKHLEIEIDINYLKRYRKN